jgi:predicted nucleotidyltransferase
MRHAADGRVLDVESIFGRKVDLVEKKALRNPYRRQAILADHRVVYAS